MMTTNYYDKDDDVDPNLDWNTERKILQTVVAIAVDGAAWTLDTLSTINMHVHGAWWEDGCYYALPLAENVSKETHSTVASCMIQPTCTTKALTTNTTPNLQNTSNFIVSPFLCTEWTHLRLIEYDFFARWRCSTGRDQLPAQNRKLRIQHRPG